VGLLLAAAGQGANIHPKCTDCHVATEPTEKSADLIRPLETLCTECHPAAEGFTQHAIGVAPEGGDAGGLPLVDGKIACITCHDSHVTTRGLLRINSEALCRACHDQ
jgi:predicted CXXCH cytochrome family protein